MGHDPSKTLLGSVEMSGRETTNFDGDPLVFHAGLAVRLAPSDELSLDGDGALVGVSLGGPLCEDQPKTCVLRKGYRVPMVLADERDRAFLAVGDVEFTAKKGGSSEDSITIALVDGGTAGSETVQVVDKAITITMEDGVSSADEIADAVEDSVLASELVSVEIPLGEGGNPQSAAAAANLAGGGDTYPQAVKGQMVWINSEGMVSTQGLMTNATVADGLKTGVDAWTRIERPVVIVDMQGVL